MRPPVMRTTGVAEHLAGTVVDSPVGPLMLVAVDGTLAGLYFAGPSLTGLSRAGLSLDGLSLDGLSLAGLSLNGLSLDGRSLDGQPGAACSTTQLGEADAGLLAEAAAQLADYFAGRRTAFDVPLTLAGTPFQRAVWEVLLTVPHGETATYGELARRVGRPSAARAVGLANGRNPISIVVPCHRVVGAAGALTGYAGGLDRKRWLLAHEQGHRKGSLPA